MKTLYCLIALSLLTYITVNHLDCYLEWFGFVGVILINACVVGVCIWQALKDVQ